MDINDLIIIATGVTCLMVAFSCGMLWGVKVKFKAEPITKTLSDMTPDERKSYFNALEFEVVRMKGSASVKLLLLRNIREHRDEYLNKEDAISKGGISELDVISEGKL